MSYTYLQGQAVVSSEVYCWDTDPCALLNMNPMPEAFYWPVKKMDHCQGSQYGTMFAPLTAETGRGKLTLFVEDSHAKTLVVPEKEQASEVKKLGFGLRCQELSMKYSLSLSLLKTHRCLWEEDLCPFSVTLPKWGMMLDGVFWEQTPLVDGTQGTGAGLWPTPLTYMNPGGAHMKLVDAVAIAEGFKPKLHQVHGMAGRKVFTGKVNPEWIEWLMGWPMGWADDTQELETDRFQLWLRQHGIS